MRGISNAHKKIIDQMLDKNSRRKQKFGSISGNRENVTGEDPIDVGTNSMGHPVTGTIGQSTECPKYMNKLCHYIEVAQGDIMSFGLVLDLLALLKKIWGPIMSNS